MNETLSTEQRVANILEGMRKAMPEIKRQIEVYEKSIQLGNKDKSNKVIVKSRNV